MLNYGFCISCGRELREGERFCTHCGHPVPVDRETYPDVDEYGRRGRWEADMNHCPECQKEYCDDADLFCRYCGKKRTGDAGRFFVSEHMNLIYGPMPVEEAYRCTACGFTWEASNWDRQYYCPKCGGDPIRTGQDGEIEIVGGREHRKGSAFFPTEDRFHSFFQDGHERN